MNVFLTQNIFSFEPIPNLNVLFVCLVIITELKTIVPLLESLQTTVHMAQLNTQI